MIYSQLIYYSNKVSVSVESYTSYPYVTEAEELQIFEKTNGNLAKYAKELTRIIFKDTLHLYFKVYFRRRNTRWKWEISNFRSLNE